MASRRWRGRGQDAAAGSRAGRWVALLCLGCLACAADPDAVATQEGRALPRSDQPLIQTETTNDGQARFALLVIRDDGATLAIDRMVMGNWHALHPALQARLTRIEPLPVGPSAHDVVCATLQGHDGAVLARTCRGLSRQVHLAPRHATDSGAHGVSITAAAALRVRWPQASEVGSVTLHSGNGRARTWSLGSVR